MACYAYSLVAGETILAKAIKVTTIRRYLKAAADLSTSYRHTRKPIVSPLIDEFGNKAAIIEGVLDDAK